MAEPRFLTIEEVLYLHGDSLERFGGSAGVREPGQIMGAISSPQNDYAYRQADMYGVAAAYAYHIAESQAFVDGNKRTGAAAAIMFLELNGVRFPKDDGSVYNALIDIAKKQLTKAGLATVLKKLVEQNK